MWDWEELSSVESEGEYHLLITHWGSNPVGSPDARDPTAIRVLEALRQQDIRVPAVVFASDIDIEARKVEALSLGAADYCFTFGALFSRLESIFAPASETG